MCFKSVIELIFINLFLNYSIAYEPLGFGNMPASFKSYSGVPFLNSFKNSFGYVASCFEEFSRQKKRTHPDIGLTIDEVIKKYDYPVETHKVTTIDGYILTVFRIPYSPNSPIIEGQKKKAIYLNHGMGGNGHQWILQYGNRNLAFLLADSGFDVFLSNCRGTSYSKEHTYMSNTDLKYWDFSWDEMAYFDVPAVMKMIKNTTGNDKMYYVGHSMGTTELLAALSEHPQLNKEIYTAFLLAPAAYLSHSKSPVRYLAPLMYNSQYLFNPILGGKIDSVTALKAYTGLSFDKLCISSATTCLACSNLYFQLAGYDPSQTNYTNMPLIMSIFPDKISTKTVVHYAQSITKGTFRKFDYGSPDANEDRYGIGVKTPPVYDLSKITAPIVLMYAEQDKMCVPKDVQLTASKLNPNSLKEKILIDWKPFTHTDFAIAKDADILVYKFILEHAKYEK